MASILITGCRGGIGLDVACRLLKRGYRVYATVHRESLVDDLRTVLKSFGENFVVDKLDVTVANDINKVDAWDIDVLINNAAIGDSGPLAEIDPQRISAVFETNVFSTLRLTQKVLPQMIAKGGGRIVLMGSMAGLIPTPFCAPYAMTKFALESVAFSLRTELKPFGIKVIVINPGGITRASMKKPAEIRVDEHKWCLQRSYGIRASRGGENHKARVTKHPGHSKTSSKSGGSPAA